jgi:hypothetical protein
VTLLEETRRITGADGMSFAKVRALAVIGALMLAALIFVTVALVKDHQSGPSSAAATCGKDAVVANIKLPEPQDVKLNVFNATDKPGVATAVKDDFANRKFQVGKTGNDPAKKAVDGVAVVRYGPKVVGAAWLVNAYFLNQAKPEFDIKRTDDVIDVVIGPQFKQLATITEVNQSLAQKGNPVLPPGTCSG